MAVLGAHLESLNNILHIYTGTVAPVGCPALSTRRRRWSSRTISGGLDPTRGLGRLGLAMLLLCTVLRIVGLLALET